MKNILKRILKRFILEFEIFFNKSHFGAVEQDYTCVIKKNVSVPVEFIKLNIGIDVNFDNKNWNNPYVEGLSLKKEKKATKTDGIFQISKMEIKKGSKVYFPKFLIQLDCS